MGTRLRGAPVSVRSAHIGEQMPLPQAVIEQDARADALLAEQAAARAAEIVEPVVAPVAATPPADPVPPAAPVTEPVVAPPEPDPPALKPADEATWEKRYHTLQGKYHAEVPRLQRALTAEKAETKRLTELLEKQPVPSLLTPEELEKYGPDFMDMVQRAAASKIEEATAPLKRKIAEFESTRSASTEDVETSAKADFFTAIGTVHGDWEEVDIDPKFIAYLAEYDPIARNTRKALLDDAVAKLDSAYVINLLNAYKASNKARPPAAPPASPEPSTSRAEPPGAPAKKIWKQAEITAFYKKASKNGYTDAEAANIEQEIAEAVADNRVR